MASELLAGLGIFKSLLDSAKGLKDINDAAVRNAAVIELQEKILAAQAAHAALSERVRELEEEVAQAKTWDAEKQRYELTDFGGGTFAYALKQDMEQGEPPHRVCANCYQKSEKSILQFRLRTISGQDVYDCPSCKAEFALGVQSRIPDQTFAETDYDPLN